MPIESRKTVCYTADMSGAELESKAIYLPAQEMDDSITPEHGRRYTCTATGEVRTTGIHKVGQIVSEKRGIIFTSVALALGLEEIVRNRIKQNKSFTEAK